VSSEKARKQIIKTVAAMLYTWVFIPCLAASLFAQNVTITVNASTVTHTINDRLYGVNADIADNVTNGADTNFNNKMIYAGIKHFRWPGGSTGDMVLWSATTGVTYSQTLSMLGTVGGAMQPIINFSGYWSGSQHTEQQTFQAAANWVRDYNGARKLNAKYWEIGNECYGPWERGNASGANYGSKFCAFYDSMKAADPMIKIGAVVTPPLPFDTLFGRFSIRALDTIAKLKHVPDFLIVHIYPYIQMDQYPAFFSRGMLPSGPMQLKDTLTTGIWVDTIASSVDTLNKWVTTYFGAANVGKMEYFYTEYSTGSYATQNQTQAISAMFISQALMEFARLGVVGSNPWRAAYYVADGNPTWYVHPMFNFHYGKQVVGVTRGAGNPHIRAWAAKDSSGNLTMFLANTSVGSAIDTAQIAIQGAASVGTGGERWTMVSSGSGAWPPQRTAISINGTVSPAANTIKTMAGQAITTGASFKVGLPPYSMTWLKIPLSGVAARPGRKTFVQTAQAPAVRRIGHREFSVSLTRTDASGGKWNVNICDIAGKKVAAWRGLDAHATVRVPGQASGIYLFVTNKGAMTFTDAVMVR
jgi:hypothetical protein